jgi:soluble cytochrome b562
LASERSKNKFNDEDLSDLRQPVNKLQEELDKARKMFEEG